MLIDRGQIELDAPVAYYWPEFAQANKSEIPVRWLLTHQCGVIGIDRKISLEQLLDWSLVVELLAAQAPDWAPGTKHGNHAITYGFLVGEVVRRVTGLTIRRPGKRGHSPPNCASACTTKKETDIGPAFLPDRNGTQLKLADSGPYAARALNWVSPPPDPTVMNGRDVMEAEIPSANGVASARALARAFASMSGPVDGIQRHRKR
jgi:hypothetical protein